MAEMYFLKNGESIKDTPIKRTLTVKEIISEHGENWHYFKSADESLIIGEEDNRIIGYTSRKHTVVKIESDEAGASPFLKAGYYRKE